MHLLKHGTSQKQPKRHEIRQNDPPPKKNKKQKTKTKQNKTKTKQKQKRNDLQNFKIRGIWNFLLAFVFQTLSQMTKFGYFGSISINFLIITKFWLYPFSKVLISNLTLISENFKPKRLDLGILSQKVLIFYS